MIAPADLSRPVSNNDICQLFDKYLKASDNYLPLKAFLESVENENFEEFSLISNVKLINSSNIGESTLPPLHVIILFRKIKIKK